MKIVAVAEIAVVTAIREDVACNVHTLPAVKMFHIGG